MLNCRPPIEAGVLNPLIHPLFRSEFNSEFWLLTTEFCFDKFAPNHNFVINVLIGWIEKGDYWYNQDDENPKTFPYDDILTSNPDIINKLSEMLVKSYNSIVDRRKKNILKNK